MGIVVNKVELGQVFRDYFASLRKSFHRLLHTYGWCIGQIGRRTKWSQSQPTPRNRKKKVLSDARFINVLIPTHLVVVFLDNKCHSIYSTLIIISSHTLDLMCCILIIAHSSTAMRTVPSGRVCPSLYHADTEADRTI
jgi:hypothetical protein